jgi:hypothetical protein
VRDRRLRAAIAEFLTRERAGVEAEMGWFDTRTAFKRRPPQA